MKSTTVKKQTAIPINRGTDNLKKKKKVFPQPQQDTFSYYITCYSFYAIEAALQS